MSVLVRVQRRSQNSHKDWRTFTFQVINRSTPSLQRKLVCAVPPRSPSCCIANPSPQLVHCDKQLEVSRAHSALVHGTC